VDFAERVESPHLKGYGCQDRFVPEKSSAIGCDPTAGLQRKFPHNPAQILKRFWLPHKFAQP